MEIRKEMEKAMAGYHAMYAMFLVIPFAHVKRNCFEFFPFLEIYSCRSVISFIIYSSWYTSISNDYKIIMSRCHV